MPARMTGLPSTVRGRNGSGASRNHHTNAALRPSDVATSAKIVEESHGTRVPPDVSARSKLVAAAIMSAAPTMSSWCGHAWRGKRFIA